MVLCTVQTGIQCDDPSKILYCSTFANCQVLVLAMALSYGVQDYIEGGVITAVIVLNVAIGFYQEFQAEKKMDALRRLSSPSTTVLRDGETSIIPSAEVVPGDIIHVKTGNTIPADIRILDAMNFECDEKILTGEAIPVAKSVDWVFEQQPPDKRGVADRINMAYSSTTVTKGRATGIVVFTGMYTEIGNIASSMQGTERKANRSMSRKKNMIQPAKGVFWRTKDIVWKFLGLSGGTPLQIKLSKLAYLLFGCAIILAVIVFAANEFNIPKEVAIYAISTGKFLFSLAMLSFRYCYYSGESHCSPYHNFCCWHDSDEETKSRYSQAVSS